MDTRLRLILADDDKDDRYLFKEALEQLPFSTQLTEFHFGDQLMQWLLKQTEQLPHVIFLDLNMPRKNGFQCLSEIKSNENLISIPIVIISTSYETSIADTLYKNGAQFYIRKPTKFLELKNILNEALIFIIEQHFEQPAREQFVLTGALKKSGMK